MKYPNLLKTGDTIGICAPSTGVKEITQPRLDKAISNVEALGYKVIETASVRKRIKCVSADSKTRAEEFMSLYENTDVVAIIPPWGGEFLMDMLPYLDFAKLSELPAKWICGYSDLTTLTFPLTTGCNIATIHGSNFMNMGYINIHNSDLQAFEVMSKLQTVQQNFEFWGGFTDYYDISKEAYELKNKSTLTSLRKETKQTFEGRMIGGCMDVLCKLIGTRFDFVESFLNNYNEDGFIWTLESCEMNAADIYRTLWQMKECGWFKNCNGIIYGRAYGYSDTQAFTLIDALESGIGELNVPVIYNADIGHIPPQMQIINGSYGSVVYENGSLVLKQALNM